MSLLDACSGPETVVPGALRGYRTWNAEAVRGKIELASTGVRYLWRPGVQMAGCAKEGDPVDPGFVVPGCGDPRCGLCSGPTYTRDFAPAAEHAAPVAECSCGFYGWYRPGDARIVPAPVFGAIEASGRLLLGSHGFRAERVRLLAVALPDYAGNVGEFVGGLARAGIRVFTERDDLINAFPPEDVSGLIDHTCSDSCNKLSAPGWAMATIQVPPAVVAAMNAQARQTLADMAKAMGVWVAANPAMQPPAPTPTATPKQLRTVLSPREFALRMRRSRGTGPQHAKRWWQR